MRKFGENTRLATASACARFGLSLFVCFSLLLGIPALAKSWLSPLFEKETPEVLPLLTEFELSKGLQEMVVSSDGSLLGGFDYRGPFEIWDVDEGRRRLNFKHGAWSISLAFSPEGAIVATGAFSYPDYGKWPGLIIRDAVTGESKRVLEIEGADSLAFSPDGELLAFFEFQNVGTKSRARVLRVYDWARDEMIWSIHNPRSAGDLRFSPNGKILAVLGCTSRGDDHGNPSRYEAWLCEVSTGREFLAFDAPIYTRQLVFSPDGRRITMTGGYWGNRHASEVKWWNVADGQEIHHLMQVDPSREDRCRETLSPDGRILVNNWPGWTKQRNLTGWHRFDNLFTGEMPGKITLHDAWSGKTLAGLPPKGIWRTVFSGDGTKLATAGPGNLIRVWDTLPALRQLESTSPDR